MGKGDLPRLAMGLAFVVLCGCMAYGLRRSRAMKAKEAALCTLDPECFSRWPAPHREGLMLSVADELRCAAQHSPLWAGLSESSVRSDAVDLRGVLDITDLLGMKLCYKWDDGAREDFTIAMVQGPDGRKGTGISFRFTRLGGETYALSGITGLCELLVRLSDAYHSSGKKGGDDPLVSDKPVPSPS